MQRVSDAGFADRVALGQPEPLGSPFRVAQPGAVPRAFSGTDANASGVPFSSSAVTGTPAGAAHTHIAGVDNMSESPFLDSVEGCRLWKGEAARGRGCF
jgi:hypothetical protein